MRDTFKFDQQYKQAENKMQILQILEDFKQQVRLSLCDCRNAQTIV